MKTSGGVASVALWLSLTAGLPLAIGTMPASLVAEEAHCAMCGKLVGIPGPGGLDDGHTFGPSGTMLMDCHAFNACHTNDWQDGPCTAWHYGCQSGPHALGQVKEAAETGSLADVLQVASRFPAMVDFTKVGYALVRDCDGHTLLGAVKLPRADGTRHVHGFAVASSRSPRLFIGFS